MLHSLIQLGKIWLSHDESVYSVRFPFICGF
jgi:hypothetical protein